MKFLCIGYYNHHVMDSRPQSEIDALMALCGPHMLDLYGTGQVLIDAGLGLETKLLRRENGALRVTDGPDAEAKERIGSAFLIEAADMQDAVRVASLHPTTRVAAGEVLGWRLEVRPVEYYGPPANEG